MSSNRTASLTATAATALVAVLAGGLIALVSYGSPAEAGQQQVRDATRDVKQVVTTGGDVVVVQKPRDAARDIVSSGARFADGEIVLRTTVRELADDGYTLLWNIGTNNTLWRVYYAKDEGSEPMITWMLSGGGAGSCPITSQESDATDTVRVVVPRSCIGNKQWIRYGAAAFVFPESPSSTQADDGRGTQRFSSSGDARLGKKIPYN